MFKTVHILAIESGNEAHALRAILECWNINVSITWVGNSDQLVDYFSFQAHHDLIIISGHGNQDSLFLPPLAPDIANEYQYQDRITIANFSHFLQLQQNTVLNLSCNGGSTSFAEVFLNKGARAYIGAKDAVDGGAALMYAIEWLYAIIISGLSVLEAHQLAANHTDERGLFGIWQSVSACS